MQLFVALAALLQVGLCGHVSIRMPYLNPAGVTYVNSFQEAPLTYAPGPQLQHVAAAPLHYAPLQYAAAAVPAKVEAHHVGYATAQVPAVATVPFVKHVPTISQVPVTRFEAQPAVLEKQVDLVKPAVSTRKFEVRRPAIQKQFYDIEQRVIIRPAGSAVVELDEPTSKLQKGPAVIQPLVHHPGLAYNPLHPHGIIAQPGQLAPIAPVNPTVISDTSIVQQTTPASIQPANNEDESVVVENADFRSSSAKQNSQEGLFSAAHIPQVRNEPRVITQSNGAPSEQPNAPFIAHDPSPSVIPSQRLTSEEHQANQNKLIELLTARGGVSEIGFGREGAAGSPIGDAGHVRARVLSATPAPEYATPTGEHISTRRVVVSRPIETLQQFDVVEPATKLERVSIQHPTFIKTAHLDHVQVHSTVPVVGKALAPAVAHATVPVYQKTISPAYGYYH